MQAPGNSRPKFVSFSGIDGSGKSTQIEALCAQMKEDGFEILLIRYWDDIARLTRLRESTGHHIFKGDKGVGSPSAPIERRDKNVRSRFMTSVRLFLYFIDAISVRLEVEKALRSKADLVVFDRYIYDELANLTLSKPFVRAYVRLIMKLVPRPDISYLLNADPVSARARKPEYPLEFLYTNRQSYLDLCEVIGGMTVIAPMPICEVERAVLGHARNVLSFPPPQKESDGTTTSTDDVDE
jgi:thymidylate kinase